jgi:hypothetical protein
MCVKAASTFPTEADCFHWLGRIAANERFSDALLKIYKFRESS